MTSHPPAKAREMEYHSELRRQNSPHRLVYPGERTGSTLNELYADLMQSTVEGKNKATLPLEDDNNAVHDIAVHGPVADVKLPSRRRRNSKSAPRKRNEDMAGMTLNEQYAAMIQAAMEEMDQLEMDPDNASEELQEEIRRFRAEFQEVME
ncbi:uncharacterized protein RCC_10914 [Ramularia collo-cygni]|uniref:Uncharacterized protein n=1 Tax=Ramularia collo-cygni TaxID=112498 RepID=A0A2D3VGQ0_9PEZI|nr:uncharacterized protein RCC_10914 [Ramularia collo-cygni]CZT25185.1 uncharacterized protein RCC_10914 [Ramularia collo-cygni]